MIIIFVITKVLAQQSENIYETDTLPCNYWPFICCAWRKTKAVSVLRK